MHTARILRDVPLLALAALVVLAAGCGGGSSGGGGKADRDLRVIEFNVDGRTDVYRNEPIEVRFSAAVKRRSVDGRTIRVLTGPNLLTLVEGAYLVDGNRVVFDPTRTQTRVDLDGHTAEADRPFGFDASADHRVYVPGPPRPETVENRAGRGILGEYVGTFRTSDLYLPEQEPPEFTGVGGAGGLGFRPEPAAGDPVAYDAEIVLEFSEPILPASMDAGSTVLVRNLDVLDFLGRPIEVPGTLAPEADGRTWVFTPSFHYGTGPYRISVELTSGITDLARNPLALPRVLEFTTEHNPDVDTIGVLSESFDTNAFEDVVATDAEWNTTVPGELRGGAITRSVVSVNYVPQLPNSNVALVDFPLVSANGTSVCPTWPKGARVQASYAAADIGMPGAITEVYWGPSSNALFAATHSNLKIRLGHTKNASGVLGSTFSKNFRDGEPSPHYDGVYHVPQDSNVNATPGTITPVTNHWPFPKLTTPFEYDGKDGLVLDFQADGANDCQLLRAWFFGAVGVAGSPGARNVVGTTKSATTGDFTSGQPLVYDMAFEIRRRLTRARSRFYDTAQPKPDYAEPILSPPVQPGGADFTLEWQGAHGMPDPADDSKVVPDPATETPWSASIDVADGHRFLRLRLVLIANLNSETVARFERIAIPFAFRP